jgi:2-polyprenyl-3-methyl-5-hydroxy-6-metoxy-1,4-benzoquinol methylase
VKVEVNRPCFLCGASNSRIVLQRTYPDFRYPGDFTLRRCAGCGLGFNSPRLAPEALAALYDRHYYFFDRTDECEFRRIVALFRRAVLPVAAEVPARRVLEVGSAKGYLLALLRELDWEVQGVEIAAAAARYARGKLGVPTFTGTLERFCAQPDRPRFPLVLALDVIEHVPEPAAFLEAASHVLEPGGLLVLDTPNGDAARIETEGANWPGFNPFHIFIFTAKTLELALRRQGFSLAAVHVYGHDAADEAPSCARQALKAMLRRVGLFEPAAGLYHIGRALLGGRGRRAFLQGAVRQARDARGGPTGFPTEMLRPAGDNLLVIARKHS